MRSWIWNPQPSRSSNAEKVMYVRNMLRRVCVPLIIYGGSTHHVGIPKVCPHLLQVDSTHLQVGRVVTMA